MKQLRRGLLLIDKWVTMLCLAVDLCILFANVVGRYVFNASIPWSEEIGRYLMIIMIYLGISYSASKNSHIRIDSVAAIYPKKVVPYVFLLGDLIWVFYCGIIVYYGIDYLMYIISIGARMVSLNLPLWPVYATIPLGHLLMGIRVAFNISDKIKELKSHAKEEGGAAE